MARTRSLRLRLAAALAVDVVLSMSPSVAASQTRPMFPELRLDGVVARVDAAYATGALAVPITTYTRLAFAAGAGRSWYRDRDGAAARVELVGRFVLDPLRERRWGAYGFGGVGALYDALFESRDRWREVLILGVGAEGPRLGAVSPAVEIAVGGGTRISIVLRRALADRR